MPWPDLSTLYYIYIFRQLKNYHRSNNDSFIENWFGFAIALLYSHICIYIVLFCKKFIVIFIIQRKKVKVESDFGITRNWVKVGTVRP